MRRGSPEQRPGEGNSLARLTPAAVIVSGPPASGKTTLATALASALHYAIMDLDTVTGPLTRAALRATTGDETAIDSPAGAAMRAARYETLLQIATANLAAGIGVVIAAPFTDERSSPKRFQALVRRLDSDVALFYIDVPDHIVRGRMESRDADRDRAKLSRPPGPTSPARLPPEAIVIDGTHTAAEQLAEALAALERPESHHRMETRAAPC